MQILKIEVTQITPDQVRWHVIGRTVTGDLKHVYSQTVAKALGKNALQAILKTLGDSELSESNQRSGKTDYEASYTMR